MSSSSSTTTPFVAKPLPALPKPLSEVPLERAKALYPYQATEANELSLMQGQILTVLEKLSNGWWRCQVNDKEGFVPGNYLEVLPLISSMVSTPPSLPSSPEALTSSQAASVDVGPSVLTDTSDFNQWVIPFSDLTLGKRLGRGSFGEVHLATYVHEPVAVKTLYVGETAKTLEDFKQEVTVIMHLKSMYIVLLRAVTIKPYSMVMEYLPKGSLTQLLHNPAEPMPWSQRHQLAADIAKGLAFLHHHQVPHRDLKSDNVLLTESYQAKLSDFGLSKIKAAAGSQQSSLTGGSVGTLCWMAPEVMDEDDKSPYRAASDVCSHASLLPVVPRR